MPYSACFFSNIHWIYERPEIGEKIFLIINSSMNTWVHIIKLCNPFGFKKLSKYFFKAQKRIKGKQDNLFKTTMFTTFIPTFQVYNKAKVEE